jgi:hypothetical protein
MFSRRLALLKCRGVSRSGGGSTRQVRLPTLLTRLRALFDTSSAAAPLFRAPALRCATGSAAPPLLPLLLLSICRAGFCTSKASKPAGAPAERRQRKQQVLSKASKASNLCTSKASKSKQPAASAAGASPVPPLRSASSSCCSSAAAAGSLPPLLPLMSTWSSGVSICTFVL